MEWHFYNFAKLFLKDINNHRHYLLGQYQLRESNFLYWCSVLHLFPPTCSYCQRLMWMSASVIGIRRGSFCFLRVPVSQNDCCMRVKLSVFVVYWVSVIAPSRPPRVQSTQDLATKWENFGDVFIML